MSADIFAWTCAWAKVSGLRVWARDETASTNSIAKDDIDPETKPTLTPLASHTGPSVYLTRRQLAGRGRGMHTWSNPDGAALLSSWSFAVSTVPQPVFSALVGLALYESCRLVWPGLSFNIKAPNDLFIGDKKTAGILIETVDQGSEKRTVIGLGLNVTGSPTDLATATHLAAHLGREVEHEEWLSFLATWQHQLSQAVNSGLRAKLTPEAAQRLCVALNLHPLLKEPILKVDELGQLHSQSRVIHWHEL